MVQDLGSSRVRQLGRSKISKARTKNCRLTKNKGTQNKKIKTKAGRNGVKYFINHWNIIIKSVPTAAIWQQVKLPQLQIANLQQVKNSAVVAHAWTLLLLLILRL